MRAGAIDTCAPASPVGDGCSVNMCVMYIGYTLRGKTESEREKMSVCGLFKNQEGVSWEVPSSPANELFFSFLFFFVLYY